MNSNLQLIQSKIYEIRGQKVMLDRDLAELYGVETRTLNQAVKRNKERFPIDFMFQLTNEELEFWKSQIVMSNSIKMGISPDFMFQLEAEEWEILKSQFVISSWGGVRKLPYAFLDFHPLTPQLWNMN